LLRAPASGSGAWADVPHRELDDTPTPSPLGRAVSGDANVDEPAHERDSESTMPPLLGQACGRDAEADKLARELGGEAPTSAGAPAKSNVAEEAKTEELARRKPLR